MTAHKQRGRVENPDSATGRARAAILAFLDASGPATAREIETSPAVASACRVAHTKARALVHQLCASGAVHCDTSQPPRFSGGG
jgi:hypothetical protein